MEDTQIKLLARQILKMSEISQAETSDIVEALIGVIFNEEEAGRVTEAIDEF